MMMEFNEDKADFVKPFFPGSRFQNCYNFGLCTYLAQILLFELSLCQLMPLIVQRPKSIYRLMFLWQCSAKCSLITLAAFYHST